MQLQQNPAGGRAQICREEQRRGGEGEGEERRGEEERGRAAHTQRAVPAGVGDLALGWGRGLCSVMLRLGSGTVPSGWLLCWYSASCTVLWMRGGEAVGCQVVELLCPSPDCAVLYNPVVQRWSIVIIVQDQQYLTYLPLRPLPQKIVVVRPSRCHRLRSWGLFRVKEGRIRTCPATRFHSASGPCGHGPPNDDSARVTTL